MNNDIGERAEKALEFGEMLKRRTGIEIVMWDERLTTVEAERTYGIRCKTGEPQAVCGSDRGCIYIAGISGLSGYAKVTGFGIQSDDKGKVYEE